MLKGPTKKMHRNKPAFLESKMADGGHIENRGHCPPGLY